MKKLVTFIKVTIAGGIVLLVPIAVLIIILSKLLNFLHPLSNALIAKLPITKIAGVGIATLTSVILLLLLSFFAGLFIKTRFAKKIIRGLEEHVLIYIPGYSALQALSTNVITQEGTNKWKPATVFIDDNELICFVIDESENYCTVFMPSAPSPSSGTVGAREKSKVTYLPLTMNEAFLLIRHFGKGAAKEIEKLKSLKAKSHAESELTGG